MKIQVCPLQTAIAEVFAQSSASGNITLADRYGLMAVLTNESISEEEQESIDRLLYSVRKGRLKVINELSAVL